MARTEKNMVAILTGGINAETGKPNTAKVSFELTDLTTCNPVCFMLVARNGYMGKVRQAIQTSHDERGPAVAEYKKREARILESFDREKFAEAINTILTKEAEAIQVKTGIDPRVETQDHYKLTLEGLLSDELRKLAEFKAKKAAEKKPDEVKPETETPDADAIEAAESETESE